MVADQDGTIAGFLDFGAAPEGLELRRLYTQVALTSRGIGSILLKELESSLPAGTSYRIVVVAANERGLAFWRRHGFEAVEEVDGIAYFSAHRGVRFTCDSRSEPLVIMRRVV